MLSSLRVLILEDESLVAMLLEDMLLDLGAKVVMVAASIENALALLQDESIDAAVLDVNIEGQRSFPVADALIARGIPFAFATGFGDGILPERYASVPVIQKPYSVDDIERMLQTLRS
jgi:CheY-like chemotaxis protein